MAIKALLLLLAILVAFGIFNFKYTDKILPNISVAEVNIGGLDKETAKNVLTQNLKIPNKIKLVSEDNSFELSTHDLGFSYDYAASVDRVFNFTRTGNLVSDFFETTKLLFTPRSFGLAVNIDETKLTKFISVISGQISVDPLFPSISFVNGKTTIDKGKKGSEMDNVLLRVNLGAALSQANGENITIPIKEVDPTLSTGEVSILQKRLDIFVGREIQIKFESQTGATDTFTYSTASLFKLINPKGGINNDEIVKIISDIAKKINRDPQNPKFNFEGDRVSEFQPALDGIRLDENKLKENLISAIEKIENSEDEGSGEKRITFNAPVTRTSPDVTTEKVNNLGIKELIGRGTSTYFHSIPGRVFNVSLATSRINGILVKPGETFSFNNALGDVSEFTGYQQAYIISEGKTILGDGGGVCQVSSTLFRALLNAGLPITERTAHAYRVGYYEQNSPPGMDATVYGPSPDLKFKNDTDNYILIVAKTDPKHYSLIFELYGTKDGRVATISKPLISNVLPALPTVYQDDPTLPLGKIKQIDFGASGAKVTFNYLVKKGGEVIHKKSFTSNYRPWAAVFIRGSASN